MRALPLLPARRLPVSKTHRSKGMESRQCSVCTASSTPHLCLREESHTDDHTLRGPFGAKLACCVPLQAILLFSLGQTLAGDRVVQYPALSFHLCSVSGLTQSVCFGNRWNSCKDVKLQAHHSILVKFLLSNSIQELLQRSLTKDRLTGVGSRGSG